MNKHILIDNLTANIGSLISGRKKFFAKSTDSQSFGEQISLIELNVPEMNSEGTFEIRATAPAGDIDPAFRIEKWLGNDYPSIIYHHGNNERPFDYRKTAKNSFMNIFVKDRDEGHRVETIEAGHVTGSLNTSALGDHILKVLKNH